MQGDKKANIFGHEINYHFRIEDNNACICFLHGYPTSGHEYIDVFTQIPSQYSVIVHDHLGFGKSDKPTDETYLISKQADIALALWEYLGVKRVHIIAHDYGTSVATEIIARELENTIDLEIESVTLCNGSMLIDLAKLRIIQRLLKSRLFGPIVSQLSSAATFHRNMENIWYDKSIYSREKMQIHWELLISENGKKVLPKITRYINQRYEHYDRWIGGLAKSKLPFHILWAANDPVAVVDMAYKLNEIIEDSSLTIIEECGHYPMIEKRELWTEKALLFIEDVSR